MDKPDKDLARNIETFAVLGDPLRRSLYLYVTSQEKEISRGEAARALDISKALAAFHLDKLAEAGLLDVTFRRISGRTGPGAGRPSKLYRRSSRELEISFPPRRYDLAAKLLASAARQSGTSQTAALDHEAQEWGRRLGAETRAGLGANPDPAAIARAILTALRTTGFEPRQESAATIILENCPFAAVQREVPLVTCGMNFALCRGLLEGLEAGEWTARLEPRPGRCCVIFEHQGAGTRLTA